MPYEIIKCDSSHLDALVEFYDAVIDHLDATVNYPVWIKGVYPARESIAGAIERSEQWARLDDGRIVGAFRLTSGCYPPAGWSVDLSDDECGVIHTFATLPELSGRGIGRQMIEWVVAHLRNEGRRAIRIDVVPENTPAIRLYERMGFRFVEAQDLGVDGIPLFNLYELNF